MIYDIHTKEHQMISKDILFDMYINKQMTDGQIAKEFNCDPTTIGAYRKKYGINTVDRNLKLHKKITKETLVNMYINKQMSDRQIAKELGCSKTTVSIYRKRYGIDNIKINISQKISKEILIDMYINKHMSDNQIAKELGCGETTISKYRKKYGIETRDLNQILTKEILIDMYINKQMTDEQIAKEFNCGPSTIGAYRKKYGINTVDRNLKLHQKITKETLEDMYLNKQMTDEQIAKEFGCNRKTIGIYRKKCGIEATTRETELQKQLTKEILENMYINKHMTDEQIAKELGCVKSTINAYRKKCGIETITRSTSVPQQEVYNEICSLFINASKNIPEITINDRKTISPWEIDIYLPEYKFGIEFNGGFWHSEENKTEYYHYNKSKLAEEKGIFIYHIYSYEWENNNKRKKILNQIKNLLGLNTNKIYARKCEIREVTTVEKRDFLDTNHIQGNDCASIKLGLYYHDELASLMTFAKPRFSKKYTWELSRFCSKANCNVIGGASKIFKYFVNNYLNKDESIVSYSDIAKTKGTLYKKLSFTFSHISDPNYIWWYSDNKYKSRYQCQIKNEVGIMKAQDYHRVYDCGNKVWVYIKK